LTSVKVAARVRAFSQVSNYSECFVRELQYKDGQRGKEGEVPAVFFEVPL